MSATRLLRSLVVLFCASLAILGCSSDTQPSDSGSLSLGLVLGDEIVINSVSWTISGNEMAPMSGDIDTSAPGATPSVEVFGLPPGDGYVIELAATSEDGTVSCGGSAEFGVVVNAATSVMVRLNCKLPEGFGSVRVNGKVNICAELIKAVVSPLQTSVGYDIDLRAGAADEDGDAVEYSWTGTGGTIADPSAPSTTYTCDEVGQQSVSVTVSDDGFNHCMDGWTVQVNCYEAGLCDGVDCDDGNECTDDACEPSNGNCVNEPVQDGTSCDGGAGSCWSGECVPIDLCEGVDCDDDNECTVDACDPNDGSCSNTPVDDNTECNDGAGVCIQGVCTVVDLCEDVDCSSEFECVEDGECDPSTGLCIDGDYKPEGTPCSFGGKCDGSGNCKINTCAELEFAVVSPLQTSVPNQISLSATAGDDDGDPIEYLWAGTGGSIDEPSEPATTYNCEDVGDHEITITVSDDGFEFCVDQWVFPITCVELP
jgi:hypothetical protein